MTLRSGRLALDVRPVRSSDRLFPLETRGLRAVVTAWGSGSVSAVLIPFRVRLGLRFVSAVSARTLAFAAVFAGRSRAFALAP